MPHQHKCKWVSCHISSPNTHESPNFTTLTTKVLCAHVFWKSFSRICYSRTAWAIRPDFSTLQLQWKSHNVLGKYSGSTRWVSFPLKENITILNRSALVGLDVVPCLGDGAVCNFWVYVCVYTCVCTLGCGSLSLTFLLPHQKLCLQYLLTHTLSIISSSGSSKYSSHSAELCCHTSHFIILIIYAVVINLII